VVATLAGDGGIVSHSHGHGSMVELGSPSDALKGND
jgi:hypothetical protein